VRAGPLTRMLFVTLSTVCFLFLIMVDLSPAVPPAGFGPLPPEGPIFGLRPPAEPPPGCGLTPPSSTVVGEEGPSGVVVPSFLTTGFDWSVVGPFSAAKTGPATKAKTHKALHTFNDDMGPLFAGYYLPVRSEIRVGYRLVPIPPDGSFC